MWNGVEDRPGTGVLGGMGESKFWIRRPASPIDDGLELLGPLADPSKLDSLFIAARTSLALGRSAGFTDSSFLSNWYSLDGRSGRSLLSS